MLLLNNFQAGIYVAGQVRIKRVHVPCFAIVVTGQLQSLCTHANSLQFAEMYVLDLCFDVHKMT